jgi:hypothetical protein
MRNYYLLCFDGVACFWSLTIDFAQENRRRKVGDAEYKGDTALDVSALNLEVNAIQWGEPNAQYP